MKTIMALFASQQDAYRAISALFRLGFPLDDIRLSFEAGALTRYLVGEQAQRTKSIQSNAFAFAVGALGGVLGLILGLAGAVALTGSNPMLIVGPLLALASALMGAGLGAAAGRLIGERDGEMLARQAAGSGAAGYYSDGFRVAVDATESSANAVLDAIRAANPVTFSVGRSPRRERAQDVLVADSALEERISRFLDSRDE